MIPTSTVHLPMPTMHKECLIAGQPYCMDLQSRLKLSQLQLGSTVKELCEWMKKYP